MTEFRNGSSMLGRVSAGVKAVALIAILGTIALAALASHRGEVDGLASGAVTMNAPANAASAPSGAADYLRQAAEAAAEVPPTH